MYGNQWNNQQGGGGYQQPQQTGYMQPQQTGYPNQQQQQQMRPMQTGMPQQQQPSGFMGSQPTGMGGMMGNGMGMGMGMQQTGMSGGGGGPGMSSMRMGGGGVMAGGSGMLGVPGQGQGQQRFGSPGLQSQPTGMGMGMGMGMMGGGMGMGGGLQPQATGYPGGMMQSQMTGMPIQDPRMLLMSSQFLPSSQPFSGGVQTPSNMNFNQSSMQPSNFQSSLQNLQQQGGGGGGMGGGPKIPWALSKEERKSYDQIFRAWDQSGSGFISGEVAREVFGQSGIGSEKLMQIWHLSDTENRGKLNLAEFHVAMGLIYRCLNGNDVPNELPTELIPPSARDLNESVDFLKDLLKKDTNVRNTTGLNIPEAGSNQGASYAKARSFHENPVARNAGGGANGSRGNATDATAYKHEDATSTGGYKSSSRHIDRKAVRYEGQSAADDLSEMKRQLANTQKLLDDENDQDEDDKELDRELDDLRYRIRRVQDDIEYFRRRGGRDSGDDRRKAERELMTLTHERLPLLERKMDERDKRREEAKKNKGRERDRRNETYSRYGRGDVDRDDRYSSSSSTRNDSSRDNGRIGRLGDGEYLRGTFDGEDSSRDRRRHDEDYSRRDQDRSTLSAPPPPPPAASSSISSKAAPPPPPSSSAAAPPKPAASPAPASMTPEQRAAWIRSEAERRVQERMRALGATAPLSSSSGMDQSVEKRLAADKAEAEARSAQADKEVAAREEARRARLEEQKLAKDKAALQTVKKEINEQEKSQDAPPLPVTQAAKETVREEEDLIRRREEVLKKEKEDREARFKKLEGEEREAKEAEERFKERQGAFASKSTSSTPAPVAGRKKGGPPPPPPSRIRGTLIPSPSQAPAAPAAPTPPAAPQPPPSPPAPQAPAATASSDPQISPSTNPFHRMQGGSASTPSATTPGGTNPFFRGQASGSESSLPAAQRATPAAQRATPPVTAQPTGASRTAPINLPPSHDEDWDDSDKDDDDEDEADGPGSSTRAKRQNLAQALFSGLIPGGRSTPPTPSTPTSAPAAPPAPPAPPAPFSLPASSGEPPARGALLGEIQGGLRLKKAVTVDKSKVMGAGAVIGDASAPVQKYVPPPSPPEAPIEPIAPPPAAAEVPNPNRQSVDWATNSLAHEQMNGNANKASQEPGQSSLVEEDEDSGDEVEAPEDVDGLSLAQREIAADPAAHPTSADQVLPTEENEEFDMNSAFRVRALYDYTPQRDEDLGFKENDILTAHKAKDGGDWSFGIMGSKKGTFPQIYVESIEQPTRARALYDYTGTSPEEASFTADEEVLVVDREDGDWWRIDAGDVVKIAPATYLEVIVLVSADRKIFESTPEALGHLAFDQNQETVPAPETASSNSALEPSSSATPIPSSPGMGPVASREGTLASEELSEEAQIQRAIDESMKEEEKRNADDRMNEDDQLQRVLEESRKAAEISAPPAVPQSMDVHEALEQIRLQNQARQSLMGEEADSSFDEDSGSGDSITGWTSSEDEGIEEDEAAAEPETEEMKRQRAKERLRVLEAAGLLVKTETDSMPREDSTSPKAATAEDSSVLGRRSTTSKSKKPKPERPERHGPPRPKRSRDKLRLKPERPLPAVPPLKPEEQMEDAYDRYLRMTKEVTLKPTGATSPRSSSGGRPQSAISSMASPPTSSRPFSPSERDRPPSVSISSIPGSPTPTFESGSGQAQSESRTSGFLSTIKNISRSKNAATPTERKPTPTISGPISGPTPVSSPPPQGNGFGSPSLQENAHTGAASWSSIVGADALSEIPDQERKRQEAIFELIETESSHVRDLQIIVEVFFNSMHDLLTEKASTVIFANIETVLIAAVTLLSDLEERQKASRLYVNTIGDLLERHMPSMNVYMPYCVNQSSAAQILEAERKRDPNIQNHLQILRSSHPAARNLDLSSFLLIPMQRVTRYPLLIGQIVKYTNEDHPDYEPLKRSQRTAEAILNTTNEAIRSRENKERLKVLSENLYIGSEARLDLTKPTRWQGERTIIKEETLTKQKSGRKITVLLTNDLVILLAGPHLYKMPMPLEEVVVRDVPAGLTGRDDLAFQLVHQGRDRVNLRCSTPRMCHFWMKAIEDARSACLNSALKSSRHHSRNTSL